MKILQRLNYNWKFYRGGKLTASDFHEVCYKKVDDEENHYQSLLKLMLYTTKPNVPAIQNLKFTGTSKFRNTKYWFTYKCRISISR